MRGHDHDRNCSKDRVGTKSDSQLPGIHAGHHQIEQRKRGLVLAFCMNTSAFSVVRFAGTVARVFEHSSDRGAQIPSSSTIKTDWAFYELLACM